MTYQEAIHTIGTIKWVQASDSREKDERNALAMAIEALEKQIPKKPIKTGRKHCYYVFYCPLCKNKVGVEKALYSEFEHHCVCGQAIDWGDDDSEQK